MKKSLTLNDVPRDERPRERMALLGSDSLSTQELLALILGRGTRSEPVMVTAQKLIVHFGSLEAMLDASLEDFQQIRGLGFAKACQLKACFAIAARLHSVSTLKKKKRSVVSPEDVYKLIRPKVSRYKKEYLLVLSFDTRNNFIGMDIVSIGTLNASLIHPRETFAAAIKRHAAAIIIVHNHPSGDPEPSDEDLRVTAKLSEAGKLMGIQLLDHVIAGRDTYFSFRESGEI